VNRIRTLKRQKARMMRLTDRLCELPENGERPARAQRLAELLAYTQEDLNDTILRCHLRTVIRAGFHLQVTHVGPE
jgi:hypothetical protein